MTVCCLGDADVQEWELSLCFCIHGEFDVGVLIVEVLKEVVQLLLTVLPNDEGVVNVSEPEFGLMCCLL